MKKLTDVDRCWPMLTGYSSHILSSHEPIWKLETGWRLPTWSILLSILKWSASIHLNPLNPWDPGCRCRSIETLPAGWRKPAGSDVSSRRRSAPRAPGNTVISANFFGSGVFRLSKYSNHIIYNVYNVYIYIYIVYVYTCIRGICASDPSVQVKPPKVGDVMDGQSVELLYLIVRKLLIPLNHVQFYSQRQSCVGLEWHSNPI